MLKTRVRRFWRYLMSLARGNSNTAAVVQTIFVRTALLVINFGTGIIVARSLGPVGRGELAAIALWPGFLGSLATLGIPTALAYHTRRRPKRGPENFVASVLMILLMGLAATGVGFVIMPLILHGYSESTIQTARACMIFAPFTILGHVVSAHLEANGAFRRSILAQLNPNLVTLFALAVLRLSDHISPISAALSYVIPSVLQTLWLTYRLWPRRFKQLSDVIRHGRVLLNYGLRSYGTDVVGTFASQIDLAVIVTFLSASQLGLYSVALTLSRLLNIVQASLVSVVFPRASSLRSEEGVALITRTARLSTVISIALGIAFLLIIPVLLPRLYGADFGAAIVLLPLLTAEAIISGLGSVLKQSFMANGKPFVVTLIEAGSIVVALALLFLLVPKMNVLGAATALLCTSIVRVAVIIIAYRLVLRLPITQFIPDAEDIAYIRSQIARLTPGRAALVTSEG